MGLGSGCAFLDDVPYFAHYDGMDSISFSECRANLKALMDRVVADKAPVTITRHAVRGRW